MAEELDTREETVQNSNEDGGEEERPYTSSGRYHTLATPKRYPYQQTKWVSRGPIVRWGTQEQLTPPSDAALKASSTPRLDLLSRPKANMRQNPSRSLFMYSCGRDSTLWLVGKRAKEAECSARVESLAKHKDAPQAFRDRPNKDQYTYDCGRVSPVWDVPGGAKSAPERPLTAKLAKHKEWHTDYRPERELPADVSEAAKRSACTTRIEDLARPKPRQERQFREAMWEIPDSTKKANASSRLLELARYKPVYEGYHYNYDQGAGYGKLPSLIRIVPQNAKRAMTSTRMEELSKPIIRDTMDKVQFNPEAFIIKPAALNAYCPPRIAELAQPNIKG